MIISIAFFSGMDLSGGEFSKIPRHPGEQYTISRSYSNAPSCSCPILTDGPDPCKGLGGDACRATVCGVIGGPLDPTKNVDLNETLQGVNVHCSFSGGYCGDGFVDSWDGEKCEQATDCGYPPDEDSFYTCEKCRCILRTEVEAAKCSCPLNEGESADVDNCEGVEDALACQAATCVVHLPDNLHETRECDWK